MEIPPQKRINSYDKMKVTQFIHPVVATKNIYKVAEKRTGDDGRDIEHITRNSFQCVHM